jgi:Skp family chaperone for outer membrane proteins
LLLIAFLIAATPAVAGKIGFVDAERAVATVKQGQARIAELEEWARPERERVERLGAKVNEVRTRLAQQRTVASPDVVESMEREELQARREFEDARRSFERELDRKQNEFLGDVAVKVGSVAAEYGRANDYDAIFVLKAQPLVYVADSADLTDTVIELYDERFPLQGE